MKRCQRSNPPRSRGRSISAEPSRVPASSRLFSEDCKGTPVGACYEQSVLDDVGARFEVKKAGKDRIDIVGHAATIVCSSPTGPGEGKRLAVCQI